MKWASDKYQTSIQMTDSFFVAAVWRYPVKGLGGESLPAAEISPGRGIAGDRRWMMATADVSALLCGREKWRPWNYGPTLKKDPRLSDLHSSLQNGALTIRARGGDSVCGDPEDDGARRRIENFLRDFFADDSIALADCDSRPAWDYADSPLTALFTADAADLSRRIGAPLSPERFRANIVIDGGEALDEMNHIGDTLHLGEEAELTAVEGVARCAATRVNPHTGERDINIPEMLSRHYRRNEMGIKCAVRRGGTVAAGDPAGWR
ncbi:MAG: MOSC domain-containing protein [Gammaproteobacteria bacterium]